ncbi:MAG: cell division protein FtsW [Chitinophagaceae bacterium]|nr:MAG: cell division protein FtsW [Chitinophagaceae bacterium]
MQALFKNIKGDRYIWMVVIILSIGSLLAVYSSTGTLAYRYQTGNTEFYLMRQLVLVFLSLGVMFLAHLLHYKYYARIGDLIMLISIPLLIFTLFMGTDLNQAKRWITLPVINLSFQTSDLAKLGLIMYVAKILSIKQNEIKDFQKGFLPIFIPLIIITLLIAPADLSTALLLFLTCFILMFIGRVKILYLAGLSLTGGVIIGLLVLTLSFSDNQGRLGTWQSRVDSFMTGSQDTYQVQQAKIAISKGGIFGSLPGKSTQRNFLPHPYSDFIYAIIIEEYGLMGGGILILLYILLLYRCIMIVLKVPNAFGALLAFGLSLSLVLQAMINMAVTVNLLPVTGLTLPFLSMGGTSLLFTSLSVGIILSISRNIEELEGKKIDATKAI